MIVQLDFASGICNVTREVTDKKFKRSGYASAESTFLYHVKQELIKQGYDVIKTRMWKDGHLVDDTQQYIRDKKGAFAIYNGSYAIYDAGEEFNTEGEVSLSLVN